MPAPAEVAALLGDGVTLGDATVLGGSRRSQVVRMAVQGVPGRESVVVKRFDGPGFARELAGLTLVARVLDEPPVPRVLAAGRGVLVLEDLGPGLTVADLLRSGDPAAPAATAELLAVYGRIAAAARGRAAELEALGGADEAVPPAIDDYLPDPPLARVAELAARLGVRVPAGAEREAATLRNGRWVSLSTGDGCPDNAIVTPTGVRVCDFELCGFRNALLDVAAARLAFPGCWYNAPLAPDLCADALAAHRTQLAAGFPEARDDGAYALRLLRACAVWAIVATGWLLPDALAADKPLDPRQPRGSRRAIAERLEMFAALAAEAAALEALGEFSARLAARLRELWG